MIGRLNHVATVPDLDKAAKTYRETLGARVSQPTPQPDHGVTVVFVELPNTKIELLHPLGDNSPIAKFLERSPDGGMHHLCYEVDDIIGARDRLKAAGARVLGDGEPKICAHGKPVLFLHPKDLSGRWSKSSRCDACGWSNGPVACSSGARQHGGVSRLRGRELWITNIRCPPGGKGGVRDGKSFPLRRGVRSLMSFALEAHLSLSA